MLQMVPLTETYVYDKKDCIDECPCCGRCCNCRCIYYKGCCGTCAPRFCYIFVCTIIIVSAFIASCITFGVSSLIYETYPI